MKATDQHPETASGYAERLTRYRRGHLAEWLAAVLLAVKGYRILARRERTAWGEIDLVAVRGRRLAFVEVKRRTAIEVAEAAITSRERARLARAAAGWVGQRPRWHEHEQGLDVVLVVPGRWPRHIVNAFAPPTGRASRRGR